MNPLPSYLHKFLPVSKLECYFPRTTQTRLRGLSLLGMVGGTVLYGAIAFFELPISGNLVLGATLLLAGIYVEQALLRFYHNYYYFQGLNSLLGSGYHPSTPISYDAALLVLKNPDDITKAVFASTIGQHIHLEAHIGTDAMADFLQNNRALITAALLPHKTTDTITIVTLVEFILVHDLGFADWLSSIGRTPAHVRYAAEIITNNLDTKKRSERWWGRDALSKRSSVGKALANLGMRPQIPFCQVVGAEPQRAEMTPQNKTQLSTMHEILAAKANTHILLLEQTTGSNNMTLQLLAKDLATTNTLNAIAGKRLYRLDTKALLANSLTDEALEANVHTIFKTIGLSGHTILVIPELSDFLVQSAVRGIDVSAIIDTYAYTTSLHIIGCDTKENRYLIQQQWPRFVYHAHELVTADALTLPTKRVSNRQSYNLSSTLQTQVINQPRAVKTVINALHRFKYRGTNPLLATGSLLFLGSESVSKKRMVDAIAKHYHQEHVPLEYIDLRQYQGDQAISNFLTTLLNLNTNGTPLILVLKNIESADPILSQTLATILSEHTITHTELGHIDCQQCIFVGMSDVGATLIGRTKNARATSPILDWEVVEHINRQNLLPASLLQSFGDTVLFDSLSPTEYLSELTALLHPIQYQMVTDGYQLTIESKLLETILNEYSSLEDTSSALESWINDVLPELVTLAIKEQQPEKGDTVTINLDHYRSNGGV